MSQNAQLQAVLYASEASFCEVSSTFGTALPLIDEVDLSGLARKKAPIPHMRQYRNEGHHDQLAPFDGQSIKLRGRMTGLGATCVAAVPSSDLWTFLGSLLGTLANGLATGGTFTGGTAAAPTTSMASGILAGGLVHGGSAGLAGAAADGRVGGQWIPVATHAASALTPLLALPGAPNNNDPLYASKNIYPTEDPGEVPNSVRLQVLTSNGHYNLRGCFITGFRKTGTMPGGIIEWEMDLGVAHVETTSATFPTATSAQRFSAGPSLVNGSFAWGTFGSTTRTVESVRDLQIEFDVTCEGIKGPGGNYEGQIYQAVRRKTNGLRITVVIDAQATGTNDWLTRFMADPNTAAVYYHLMISLLVHDGRAIGLYVRRAKLCDAAPVQISHEGYNRLRLTFEATANTAGADVVRRSSWILGGA